MIHVHNLGTDEVKSFDDDIVLEYALVYCFTNSCEAAFEKLIRDVHNDSIDYSIYPLVYGDKTIGCGDWAVLKSR